MGDGTKENPFTREDVLRLIEENGGTAEALDLSGKAFEEGIDLCGLDLHGINLECANLEQALLSGTNLQKANLCDANLQGAKCGENNLRNAVLVSTDLRGTVMAGSDMRGAIFLNAKFNRDTDFINVNWGSKYFAPRWLEKVAQRTYLELKNWHRDAGMYDIAGEFYYREMAAKRNSLWLGEELIIWLTWSVEEGFIFSNKSRIEYLREHLHPFKPKELLRVLFPRKPFHWAWSTFFNLICGYGERPLRVVVSAGVVVFSLALIYFAIGTLAPNTFLNNLYYSAASFTTLGYGSWAPEPTGWIKGLGVFEAFIGVFMMALFLITFVRKMTR